MNIISKGDTDRISHVNGPKTHLFATRCLCCQI